MVEASSSLNVGNRRQHCHHNVPVIPQVPEKAIYMVDRNKCLTRLQSKYGRVGGESYDTEMMNDKSNISLRGSSGR